MFVVSSSSYAKHSLFYKGTVFAIPTQPGTVPVADFVFVPRL